MQTHFKYFDLKSGTPLPRFKSMAFFAIVYRARTILTGRCPADIEVIAASIPRISRLRGYADPIYATLAKWAPMIYMDPKGMKSEAVPSTSEVWALVHNIDRVDLSDLAIPNINWPAIFSTLALLYVESALRTQANYDDRKTSKASSTSGAELKYASDIAEDAIAATEAIMAAELGEPSLVDQTILEEHWAGEKLAAMLLDEKKELLARLEGERDRRKSIASKGGRARHAQVRALVADFVRYFDSPGQSFKSRSQAVDLFLKHQDPERLKGFSRTNIKRTLLDWLRAVKNGTRTILPGS